MNTIDEPVRVTVRVERDGTTVFDGTTEFDDDGTVERIEGDDFRAAEFSEAGTYTLAVEANGAQEQSSTDVSWRYLTDCNYNTLEVLVREDGIDAGLIRTDAGCSFPDTLGKERRQ
ncbi:hypothetical protein [Natronobacterium texcoconense]|uniref:hypothetical protein n=1 Tax=Natronobacterium texcoconense TaxID=1095778 RepID=UPI000B80EEE4|nr:hypothetical protein [Natronobacterium texcoconense]